jgi:hypothetical protein
MAWASMQVSWTTTKYRTLSCTLSVPNSLWPWQLAWEKLPWLYSCFESSSSVGKSRFSHGQKFKVDADITCRHKWFLWFFIVTMSFFSILTSISAFTQCTPLHSIWDPRLADKRRCNLKLATTSFMVCCKCDCDSTDGANLINIECSICRVCGLCVGGVPLDRASQLDEKKGALAHLRLSQPRSVVSTAISLRRALS